MNIEYLWSRFAPSLFNY